MTFPKLCRVPEDPERARAFSSVGRTALTPVAMAGEEQTSPGCRPAPPRLGCRFLCCGPGGWASPEGVVKCVLHGISEVQTSSFFKGKSSVSIKAIVSGQFFHRPLETGG